MVLPVSRPLSLLLSTLPFTRSRRTHQLATLTLPGGLFPYPVQALIQASVQHERTATVTALYLASYSVGSALGNTIAGGIWVNTMPDHLLTRLTEAGVEEAEAATIATSVFANPEGFIDEDPRGAIGTPEREAIMAAYGEVQRYLTIAGLCLSVLLVIATLCLRDPKLGDQQSFQDAEGVEVTSVDSVEKGGRAGSRDGSEQSAEQGHDGHFAAQEIGHAQPNEKAGYNRQTPAA